MKKLYFIRHGESEGNLARIFSGQADHRLTAQGRMQAQLAAQEAAQLSIDLIISSPLSRALETAQIIAESVGYPKNKIMLSDLLMERNYGELQNKPYEVIPNDREGLEKVPGIEPEAHLMQRARQAAEFLKGLEVENVLVVGHGTMGRTIWMELIENHSGQIEVPIEYEIPNAKVVQWI
jgi:broad specificity phosphatase PhoE